MSVQFDNDIIPRRENVCPYDHSFCMEKQKRLENWQQHIAHMAKNRINATFFTSESMFDKCPLKQFDTCVRFRAVLTQRRARNECGK